MYRCNYPLMVFWYIKSEFGCELKCLYTKLQAGTDIHEMRKGYYVEYKQRLFEHQPLSASIKRFSGTTMRTLYPWKRAGRGGY